MFGVQSFIAMYLDHHISFFLEFFNLSAFLILQIRLHTLMHSHGHSGNLFPSTGQHQFTNDFDRDTFSCFDKSSSTATGAIILDAPFKTWADALSGHFDQSKRAGTENFCPGTVPCHGITQCSFHTTSMFFLTHIDEVINNHST